MSWETSLVGIISIYTVILSGSIRAGFLLTAILLLAVGIFWLHRCFSLLQGWSRSHSGKGGKKKGRFFQSLLFFFLQEVLLVGMIVVLLFSLFSEKEITFTRYAFPTLGIGAAVLLTLQCASLVRTGEIAEKEQAHRTKDASGLEAATDAVKPSDVCKKKDGRKGFFHRRFPGDQIK